MTDRKVPGLCGLKNLGNTCYMSCVLQCMSNCPPLASYFLLGRHKEELNKDNPLGMGGALAAAFGDLIASMWSGKRNYIIPKDFKTELARFNSIFAGFQQHDCQELLTFLLDGLLEDLNRIKQKPYTLINDDLGREDKILAQEAWDRHRNRNDSIIVDNFHGLLKSQVVCPDCKTPSVTFDPFCYLSLPLPRVKRCTIEITHVPYDGTQPSYKYKLNIPREGCIQDLCREAALRLHVDPSKLLVAEIRHSHFHKLFTLEDTLDNIIDHDFIYIYDLPSASDEILIPVCFWEVCEASEMFDNSQLFGVPFILSMPKSPISENELRHLLLDRMQRNFSISARNGTEMGIYTKNTNRTSPTPLEFEKKKLELSELFEPEDSSKIFCGRTMVLGFTQELKRGVYVEQNVKLSAKETTMRSYRAQNKLRISIADCLNSFTTVEKLEAGNAWYCANCKQSQVATKQIDLWDLPKILIVHLKRFSYTRLDRDKIEAMVDCPLKDFDMGQYLIKDGRPQCAYNLIGVCNHYGGMGSGHYTASCKNKDTGEWYYFDDDSVMQIPEDRVMTTAAYLLFYMAADQ